MRKYEIALLFDAGLEKKKLEKVLKDFEGFVKKSKGQIIEKEQWKERKLAYPIKKAESGIYFFAHYELETDKNDALLKDLNLNQNILRYLITIPSKGAKLEGEPKKVKREKGKGKREVKEEVRKEEAEEPKEEKAEKLEREKVKPEEVKPEKGVKKEPAITKVEKIKKETVEKEVKEKPRVRKTVEESKKAKAREQKEKKVSEEKLDQEIDRILSDEDLL